MSAIRSPDMTNGASTECRRAPEMGDGEMPTEYVYEKYKPTDATEMLRAVKVGWGKEAQHVQVAVVLPNQPEIDVKVDDTTATMTNISAGRHHLHIQLDRDSINHLIRTLRRARDQAFGRDE